MQIDSIKEIYNFYPRILLNSIGEDSGNKILELPKLISQYANNPNNEAAYAFEKVLKDGFEMFYNVKTELHGGAGNSDIEGLYITCKKKFAVEAKSTANKLLQINSNRLKHHRNKIGAKYSIVITPRYVPAALRDIEGENIVI